MNLTEAIDWATDQLQSKQIEDARQEAEFLLVYALEINKSELILNQSLTIDDNSFNRFKALIERRLKHEPTAYITGIQPFMSLDFIVNRSVLIPRPETELLVEKIIELVKEKYSPHLSVGNQNIVIADIGTGSGCIAVSLAKFLPNVSVIGIDSSSKAIEVAKKNAEKHKVSDRCQFMVGNLFDPLKEKADIIISNPPYIPSETIKTLQPEVKDWEPRQALDGGKDGLDYITKIIREAPNHLPSPSGLRQAGLTTEPPGSEQSRGTGCLFIEIGFDQGPKVRELAGKYFKGVEVLKDLSGNDRILRATAA